MLNTIQQYLSPAHPWFDHIRWFDTIDSTNSHARLLADKGAPHGTVLIAGHQTGGRGRMGRSFDSPAGMGIYLSVILRPQCSAQSLMHLTCATGKAMCDAVEKAAGFRPGIKWTNDLVFEKRKLGGILVEMSLDPQSSVPKAVIIGVGINCRQQLSDFPSELQGFAGSLEMVTGSAVDPAQLAAAMIGSLAEMDRTLLSEKRTIMNAYRRDCVTLGQDIVLVRGDEKQYGKALDIDEDGGLVVTFTDGSVKTVTSGEVSIRGMYGYL